MVEAKNVNSVHRSSIAPPSNRQSQSSRQHSSLETKRNSNTKNAKMGTTPPIKKKGRGTISSYLYHTCVSIIRTLLCASLKAKSFSHHPSTIFLNYIFLKILCKIFYGTLCNNTFAMKLFFPEFSINITSFTLSMKFFNFGNPNSPKFNSNPTLSFNKVGIYAKLTPSGFSTNNSIN